MNHADGTKGWMLVAALVASAGAQTDTAWSRDYASELPVQVRERLQQLRKQPVRPASEHPSPETRATLKAQREQFLQSLPEGQREKLRQKIRELEERPKAPRNAADGFRG